MPKKVLFRLTALGIKKLKKPGRIADGNGLYLQVTKGGSKSWLFRYRLPGQTPRQHGLGAVEKVSLEEARQEALRCQRLLREGIDPIEERKARVGAAIASQALSQTFEEVAEAFIVANEPAWSNAKHVQQWRNTLAAYAYPEDRPRAGAIDCDRARPAMHRADLDNQAGDRFATSRPHRTGAGLRQSARAAQW